MIDDKSPELLRQFQIRNRLLEIQAGVPQTAAPEAQKAEDERLPGTPGPADPKAVRLQEPPDNAEDEGFHTGDSSPLRTQTAEAQPRNEEEPFSEGFWAGRLSDRSKPTGDERERAYQAYIAGERWNRGDGDMRPLQDRVSSLSVDPARVQKP